MAMWAKLPAISRLDETHHTLISKKRREANRPSMPLIKEEKNG